MPQLCSPVVSEMRRTPEAMWALDKPTDIRQMYGECTCIYIHLAFGLTQPRFGVKRQQQNRL